MLTPPNEYDSTVLYSKKDYEIWRIREVSSYIQVYISQILKRKHQHGIIVPRNSWSCNQYNNQMYIMDQSIWPLSCLYFETN